MSSMYDSLFEIRDLVNQFSGENAEEVSLTVNCLRSNCYGDRLGRKINIEKNPVAKLLVRSNDGIMESEVNVYSKAHTLLLMCILQTKGYEVDLLWEKE